MYEDTPAGSFVHDLFSEAVFGDQPLGRSGSIGNTRRRDSQTRQPGVRSPPITGLRCTSGSNIVVGAGVAISSTNEGRAPRRGGRQEAAGRTRRRRGGRARAGRPAARPPARRPPGLRLPAEGHRAVPRLASARPAISRPPTGAGFAASLASTRSLGGSASSRLFQEIREKKKARAGLRGLQLSRRQYTDNRAGRLLTSGTRGRRTSASVLTSLPGKARGESPAGRPPAKRARGVPEGESEGPDRALDGNSTSNRM